MHFGSQTIDLALNRKELVDPAYPSVTIGAFSIVASS
jgi:hypothetical protein